MDRSLRRTGSPDSDPPGSASPAAAALDEAAPRRSSARRAALASQPRLPRRAALAAALLVVLAAACAPAPAATPTPSPVALPTPSPTPADTLVPDGDLAALFRQIEDQVLEMRGLPVRERLEPTILSEAEAREAIREHFEKDNPPAEVEISEEILQALNLLPADASLADLYIELLGSQVAGYYDPETEELVVVSREDRFGAMEKVTYAHEFTHALQDQNFDLEEITIDELGQSDRSLARLAFIEGDATLLMTLWLTQHLEPEELQELLEVDPEDLAILEAMPAILRETLLFPYQQGLVFVNRLWAEGGWEWVDRAYGRLPDSTEQILHPEKWEAGERPVEVVLDSAAIAAGMGDGWSGAREDTLGEFQLSIWLQENGLTSLDAQEAAAGWGGDRLAYVRGPDGAFGLVLATVWDTEADAAEFLDAAHVAVGTIPATFSTEEDGRRVALLLASDQATLERLETAALPAL
jgi:hypothetical protein